MQRTSTEAVAVPIRRRKLRRRGETEIALDLLDAFTKYPTKTNQMFKANTSWLLYTQKMAELEAASLIKDEQLTPLGHTILDAWRLIRFYFPYRWFTEGGWR